jgi:hypothetical protein
MDIRYHDTHRLHRARTARQHLNALSRTNALMTTWRRAVVGQTSAAPPIFAIALPAAGKKITRRSTANACSDSARSSQRSGHRPPVFTSHRRGGVLGAYHPNSTKIAHGKCAVLRAPPRPARSVKADKKGPSERGASAGAVGNPVEVKGHSLCANPEQHPSALSAVRTIRSRGRLAQRHCPTFAARNS